MASTMFKRNADPSATGAEPEPERPPWTARASPFSLGLLGIAYFVTGWLGLQLPQIGEHITLLWPPTGIAIFGLVRFGLRGWPAIAVAAFVLNLTIGTPWIPALGITVGNTAGPWIAAYLLTRRAPPNPRDGVVGSARFIAIAGGSMLVPATVGPLSLVLGGVLDFGAIVRAIGGWWAGDALGAVVVGSLLLSTRPCTWEALRTPVGLGRYVFASAAVGIVSVAAFYGGGVLPFVFATLLVLAFVSALEPRFTSGSAVMTAAIVAVLATTNGMGPFARDSIHSAMPIVLSYVAALAAMQILVHAVVRDHQALGESEMRNRRLLEAAPDALLLVSSDGMIVDVNERACRGFGRARDEVVGAAAYEFDQAATHEDVAALVRSVIRRGTRTFETDHIDSTGKAFPVEVHLSPYKMDSVDCVIAVVRDISQRREEERARRDNEMRLQAIFEHEPECVKTLDRDCRLLEMNPAGLRMIAGGSIEAVRGLDTRDLIAPEHRAEFEEGVRAVFEGETTFQIFEIIALDGTRRWMEQHASPLPSPDDPTQIAEMLAVTRDITERRETERRLLQKQRVEALGSLAGGIAHDLNNTLSPVLLSVDELYDRLGPDDPLVATVEHSAERAVDTIRHLLSFARGSEGARHDVSPFDLLDEVERIVDVTFPRTIDIEVERPASLPLVRADANQLHQVLVNLCVNARDAMPEGGRLRIEAETRNVDAEAIARGEAPAALEPGRFVVFHVEDTGRGIAEEHQLQIFEPFFSTKPADEGTGLGLASASGIVGNLGGAIDFETEVGEGARFRVHIPALERTVTRDRENGGVPQAGRSNGRHPRAEPTPTIDDTATTGAARGRILLVDDEAAVRSMAEHALRRLGYEVHAAGDAQEALRLFERIAPVEAIVSDLRMPGMSGDELIRTLRARVPGLPAILTSGHMDAAGVDLPEVGGADEIVRLHKPYRIRALRDALTQATGS